MTWFRLWPIFTVFPLLALVLGLRPTVVDVTGHVRGGGPFRAAVVDRFVGLDLLPSSDIDRLLSFWQHATAAQEIAIYLMIALNVCALLSMPLFLFGEASIRLSNWFTRGHLSALSQGMRRS